MDKIAESIRKNPGDWDINKKACINEHNSRYSSRSAKYIIRHVTDKQRQHCFDVTFFDGKWTLTPENGVKIDNLTESQIREIYYAAQAHVENAINVRKIIMANEFLTFYSNVK
jgi:hypothetical protein